MEQLVKLREEGTRTNSGRFALTETTEERGPQDPPSQIEGGAPRFSHLDRPGHPRRYVALAVSTCPLTSGSKDRTSLLSLGNEK